MRIALIFDDHHRKDTTGVHVLPALQGLAQVTHFRSGELNRVPRTGFDLYLVIDDGLDYRIPDDLRPRAYWAIDTHVDFERAYDRSQGSDLVFAAQNDGARKLAERGIRDVEWLPLAANPEIHRPRDVRRDRDVAFVGNMVTERRETLLRLIQRHFANSFVGQAYFDELSRIYSSAKMGFNCPVQNDINMRSFEIPACGAMLLTADLADNGQGELLRTGTHLEVYHDADDLLEKLRYYLAHDELRERIGAAGRAEVLAKHTYAHRMRRILESFSSFANRTSVAVRSIEVQSDSVAEEASKPYTSSSTDRSDAMGYHVGDPAYFMHARSDLLGLVPPDASSVLEIGCGEGRLGASLKSRQPCRVVGIERDEAAAAQARRQLDEVHVLDVERSDLDFEHGQFDCIVCGGVLERLSDPGSLLRRSRRWLKPHGMLVASIPNVRHHSVIASLLDGNWTYQPAGLLDHTHRRFFTRSSLLELMNDCGYRVDELQAVPGTGHDEWQAAGRPGEVRLGRLTATGLDTYQAEEFFIYQYLVTARPAPDAELPPEAPGTSQIAPAAMTGNATVRLHSEPPAREVVDSRAQPENPAAAPSCSPQVPSVLVLMITFNRLDYTRTALEAALALAYPQWELVVWDNASTDGTLEYLRERLRDVPNTRLVASPRNMGVVHPMNEVWFSDNAAQLVAKIDNDTWVPPDLLARLAECHQASRRFGVLSGFHFRAEGEALADDRRVDTIDGVRLLAQPFVGGCAVMARRSVLAALGPIPCRQSADGRSAFMDSGWTTYQNRMSEAGLVNGYPWPPIHVDHMEQTILDVGSAIDELTKGVQTRSYQQRGTRTAELVCTW